MSALRNPKIQEYTLKQVCNTINPISANDYITDRNGNKLVENVVNEQGVEVQKQIKAIDVLNTLTNETFGADYKETGQMPNPSIIHNFNTVIIRTAEGLYQPVFEDFIALFATYDKIGALDTKIYDIETELTSEFYLSATNSDVVLQKVGSLKKLPAGRKSFATGFTYNPADLVKDPAKNYNKLLQQIGKMKNNLYMNRIQALIKQAQASNLIPPANVLTGANVSYKDFQKLCGKAERLGAEGGRCKLMADAIMINDIANKVVGASSYNVPESLKKTFFENYAPSNLGVADGIKLLNGWRNQSNTKVTLDVTRGYMVANARNGENPIVITEYGGLNQTTTTNKVDGMVNVRVNLEADITLLYPRSMFIVEDTDLTI